MPPSFMVRNSRSSSPVATAGPNHHQRTMMRASAGGCSKARRRSAILAGEAAGDAAGSRKQPAASRATTPHHNRFVRIRSMLLGRRKHYKEIPGKGGRFGSINTGGCGCNAKGAWIHELGRAHV